MKPKFYKSVSLFHTEEEHIIKSQDMLYEMKTVYSDSKPFYDTKIKECDKSIQSMNMINDNSSVTLMEDIVYTRLETKRNGISVIFEFPNKSKNEETIHEEVKNTLSTLLQEQIKEIQ